MVGEDQRGDNHTNTCTDIWVFVHKSRHHRVSITILRNYCHCSNLFFYKERQEVRHI